MRAWVALAGGSDLAVLLPGVAFGIGTIVLVWFFAREAASEAGGLAAAALVAVSPQVLRADGMARPYAFLALIAVLAVGFLWIGLTRESRRAFAGWSACCIVLLYTHNWTVLPVAAMCSLALWHGVRSEGQLTRRSFLIAAGAVLLAWLPWAPSLAHQASHGGHLRPETSAVLRGAYQAGFVLPGFSARLSLVFLAALGGMLVIRRGGPRQPAGPSQLLVILAGGTALLSVVFAICVSMKTNLLVAQAVRMLSPLLLLSVGVAFTRVAQAGRVFAPATLILLIVLSGVEAWSSAFTPRSDASVMARLVSSAAARDDLVLVVPSPLASSFLRYYTGSATVEAYPRGLVERPAPFDDWPGRDTNPRDIEDSAERARRVLEGGGRVWQVATTIPKPVQSASEDFVRRMTNLAGTPTTWSDERSRAWPEEVVVRVWGPVLR